MLGKTLKNRNTEAKDGFFKTSAGGPRHKKTAKRLNLGSRLGPLDSGCKASASGQAQKNRLNVTLAGSGSVLASPRSRVGAVRGTSERQGFGEDGFLIVLGFRFGLVNKKHQVA